MVHLRFIDTFYCFYKFSNNGKVQVVLAAEGLAFNSGDKVFGVQFPYFKEYCTLKSWMLGLPGKFGHHPFSQSLIFLSLSQYNISKLMYAGFGEIC